MKNDPEPAYQLRRYAYSAKLPISILMDFEEFSVYDTTLRPAPHDKPHVGRILYLNFQEYCTNWDMLEATFSKEAVLRGDLERFIQTKQGKKSRAEIDRDFLNDLDRWRILLARNLALRNSNLSERELNFAVQMTIDRLIFLRMSEDRGIENQYPLQALLNGENVYRRLVEIYYRANERYNSGLFHFTERDGLHPDTLTPRLNIDDKILKEIISELYYPNCPYEFSILPVEILGNAYEQFLGKRISLTAGHHARIEEKPEVRKAGGVYYTPQYIVDYIVKNTIGKILTGKTPIEAAQLRVLDPACGSGSFLLGSFQFLMDWHLDYYRRELEQTGTIPLIQTNKTRSQHKSATQVIYQGQSGNWFLSTAEKKRILLNNIFGVDIDPNAVEVTKLSLLLKVLENENNETLAHQLAFWHERVLPNLAHNIKCGNSLIGTDYYSQQVDLFDENKALRVNAFDWDKEFPQIFASSGFDVVIGNPPYVRQEMVGEFKTYFQQKYQVYQGTADLYVYFIEKGIRLLKPNGHFAFIVSNKWLRANYGRPLRQWLQQYRLAELIDFGDLPVFRGITTYPCILQVIKTAPAPSFQAVQVKQLDFPDLSTYVNKHKYSVEQSRLDPAGWSLSSVAEQNLLAKLYERAVPLGKYVNGKIYYGIKTGLNEAFVISPAQRAELIAQDPHSAELIKPFLIGKEIKRYAPLEPAHFLIFIPKGWTNAHATSAKNKWDWFQQEYSAIAHHLLPFKTKAEKRYDKGDYWWELRACEYYQEFDREKNPLPQHSQKTRVQFRCFFKLYQPKMFYHLFG